MENIVVLIWITICLGACLIGGLMAMAIARYVEGYTKEEIRKEIWGIIAPKEEDLY